MSAITPSGVLAVDDAKAQAAYEAATALDRRAPGGAMTWAELSEAMKQEWRNATAGVRVPDGGQR